jgi:hypothetical protein
MRKELYLYATDARRKEDPPKRVRWQAFFVK